jgi:hypothetical protein
VGSAPVSRAGFGVAPKRTFSEMSLRQRVCEFEGKFANARGLRQHAGRVRYPIRCAPAE